MQLLTVRMALAAKRAEKDEEMIRQRRECNASLASKRLKALQKFKQDMSRIDGDYAAIWTQCMVDFQAGACVPKDSV